MTTLNDIYILQRVAEKAAEKMKKDGKDVLVEEVKADMRGEGYFQLMLFQIVDGKKNFVKACSSYQKA